MKLKDHFERLGDKAAAKRYKITERAARSYREGKRTPRPDVAKRIAKLSNGDLSLAEIYS